MQIKLLKNVVADIAGKQTTEIVDLLVGKKDVNEFLIAKKLKLTINQTRNILYKLSDAGLVSFTRKKDKRKGWYIYFWTLNSLKSLELLERKFLDEISQLESQLKSRKTRRFYFCKTCNVEVGEETALLNEFTCQECGEIYELAESDKIIKEMENQISKLRRNLGVIKEEREKEAEKQEKKKARARKLAKKKRKKKVKKKVERKETKEKTKKKKIKKKAKSKAKKKTKEAKKKVVKKKQSKQIKKKIKKSVKKKIKKKKAKRKK